MKVFIICTVRNANPEHKQRLEDYARRLERQGMAVHLPHRDTDQTAKGVEICRQNMEAIKTADEVHIFYNSKSQGTHFDMGVSFALGKRIIIAENEPLTEGRSFQKMLTEWAKLD